MTEDSAPDSTRLAIRIYLAVLVVLVIAALLVWTFGLPALGLIGIALTLVVFAIMLTFTSGN
ncbi:hypothetical protein [Paracoccus salsus]|uniref:hypothetical protein n=1 Tax=Paracoccus salsus TaxID=2911061 RepID=UPI001F44F140|nr:hypothetical protein [Paracoccus salsus]MCF3973156.1 hypothetical protein [Paracoccus salsus]